MGARGCVAISQTRGIGYPASPEDFGFFSFSYVPPSIRLQAGEALTELETHRECHCPAWPESRCLIWRVGKTILPPSALPFPAYNSGMRRGWAVLLMVMLAMSGVAPFAAAHQCCVANGQNNCCRPMGRMQADCCGVRTDSGALSPEELRNVGAPAGLPVRVGVEFYAAERRTGVATTDQRPPGLHAPPLVLRI